MVYDEGYNTITIRCQRSTGHIRLGTPSFHSVTGFWDAGVWRWFLFVFRKKLVVISANSSKVLLKVEGKKQALQSENWAKKKVGKEAHTPG